MLSIVVFAAFSVFAASVSPALAGSAIAVILGLVFFLWGLKSLRESRVVAQIPQTAVSGIATGPVHLHGKTSGDAVLMSPMTGVPCYYYKALVEKLVKQGNQERWEDFKNESAQQNFYIDDGTGRVLIDPRGLDFNLPQTLQAEIGINSNHSCHIDPSLGLPRPNENQLHAVLLADWRQARAAVQALGMPGTKVVDKVLAAGETMGRWGIAMNVAGVEINPGGVGESYRLRETCLLAGHEYSVVGTCEQDAKDEKVVRKGDEREDFSDFAQKWGATRGPAAPARNHHGCAGRGIDAGRNRFGCNQARKPLAAAEKVKAAIKTLPVMTLIERMPTDMQPESRALRHL